MADDKVTRRLAAIFAADMVGYSRLMEADEEGIIARQKVHRKELIEPKIAEHHGRIVKTTGDGMLVEFASVVDAVRCAVEVQLSMAEREADVPDDRRISYRIGINLGDIVIEDDDVMGDGVNVAARLEALAKPGEVLISGTAFDQLKKKLEYGYHFRGERKVKNITEPVRIYAVLPDTEAGTVLGRQRVSPKVRGWISGAAAAVLLLVGAGLAWWQPWVARIEPARLDKMAFPLPAKPSIAVLPFNNLSGDKSQDYLADGLSENIISALSKVSEMFVIARNSTFTYKGKPVKVQRVAEEMGVRYVLEGSVQKSGDRIRVTAQLIDAVKGHHLWSERYDRKLTDLFAVQDEITTRIVVALQVRLTEGEQARIRHRSTSNLEAWGYAVKAASIFRRFTKADNARARELFERAIKLDPRYATAWRGVAWTHWIDMRFGFSTSRRESFRKAAEYAEKAIALAPDDPDSHSLMGGIHLVRREYAKAVAEGRKAIILGPNMAELKATVAITMFMVGDWEETIALCQQAMRQQPSFPSWYTLFLARAYVFNGQREKAVEAATKGLDRAEGPSMKSSFHMTLAFAYSEVGRLDDARRHMAMAQRLFPVSAKYYRKAYFFKNPAHLERMLAALRKAGLPEGTPPLPKKPSIAVLPFTNMSGDKDQEYFADGMTDDLITGLSKVSGLIVVSRTSAFTFRGTKKTVKEIARALGVRYVIEGSVRRAGGKVRINAQLIDATTGGHVWAETFDRDYKHIFALQDEVKGKIIQALKVKLSAEERKQLKRRPTKNLGAYDLYLKAEKLRLTFNGYKYRAAFVLYDKALALDPDFLDAHIGNAKASFRAWRVGYTQAIFPPKAKLRTQNSLARILALDPDNTEAAALQAGMQLYLQKHDLALALARSAVARHPRNATLQSGLARVLLASDRLEEARAALKRAEALAPKPSPDLLIDLARDYLMLGEAKPAVDHLVHARNTGGSRFLTALLLANAYARLGNMRKASVEWKIARKFLPWLSVSWFRVSDANYRNKRLLDEYFKAYLKAGLPEWPYGFKGRAEHRLRNAELRALYFGRPSKTISTSPSGSFEEYLNDGKGNWTGKLRTGGTEIQYEGRTTIEGDRLCYRTAAYMIGRKICGEFYRNPEGSPETNNEYIRINMFGKKFFSFKPVAEK